MVVANSLAEAILPINPGQAGSGYNSSDAWDYFHINSVDKDAEGNYLISARDACAIHKINGSDGSIIWRLNGKKSDFYVPDNAKFCFQHHARWLSQEDGVEIISLYDNSAHGTEHGEGREVHTAPTSSGKILRLDTNSWTAELVQGFYPPDDLLSKSQGSTQVQPGGNVLVNWGSSGALTEYKSDGTPIFHAYVDSGDLDVGAENYRAFRFNWTGLPNEEPAISAVAGKHGTTAYVSWNGDTETKTWRFYSITDEYGSKSFLGEKERISFETSLFIPDKKLSAVSAEALDARGRVLRHAAATSVEDEILPYSSAESSRKYTGPSEIQKGLSKPSSTWEEYAILKVMRLHGSDL